MNDKEHPICTCLRLGMGGFSECPVHNKEKIMTEREKLADIIIDHQRNHGMLTPLDIADWVIEDRKRIVEPLIDFSNQPHTYDDYENRAAKAMVQTLTNAGLTL